MLTREQARTKFCPYRIAAFMQPDEFPEKEWYFCTADDCPKWVDIANCPDVLACQKFVKTCNDCPHRYGRCGG